MEWIKITPETELPPYIDVILYDCDETCLIGWYDAGIGKIRHGDGESEEVNSFTHYMLIEEPKR